MNPDTIILYPLMGEKATLLREKENKLTFIVAKNSRKSDIKKAVEDKYQVEVLNINTMVTMEGKKKAHVRLSDKHSAEEVASHFGVL